MKWIVFNPLTTIKCIVYLSLNIFYSTYYSQPYFRLKQLDKLMHNMVPLLFYTYNSVIEEVYQPKATTLTCVLVRMVALVLIFDCSSSNYLLSFIITLEYKATSINEYFTPYACSIPSALACGCKVISMYHTPHLALHPSSSCEY